MSVDEIYNQIEKLILSPKKLLKLQKDNFKSFIFNHKFIADRIDKIRNEFIKINNFNYLQKNILKIMHITNFNDRFNGRLHYNTGRRLNNGFIRNGHNVLSLSDRDILNQNKKIGDLSGNNFLQNKIISTYNNFRSDLLVLGHADKVSNQTLEILKDINKNIKIAQWFLDPLSKFGPDHENNKKRILDKLK